MRARMWVPFGLLTFAFGCSGKANAPTTSTDVADMEAACRTEAERRSDRSSCVIDKFCRCAASDYVDRASSRAEYRSIMSDIAAQLDVGNYYCVSRAESACPAPQKLDAGEDDDNENTDDGERVAYVAPGPARGLPVNDAFAFTLGSSREEVEAVQGKPDRVDTSYGETWWYGASTIKFAKGKVFEWQTLTAPLHATLKVTDTARFDVAKSRGTFTLGDTKDDVLGVHGVPTSVDSNGRDQWWYQASTIEFQKGKVVAWRSMGISALNVALVPNDKVAAETSRQRGTWSKGATSDEVLAVEGVPTTVDVSYGTTWWYGASRISFEKGKVNEVSPMSVSPLKGFR